MQCQHCILGIRWSDFATNLADTEKTGLPDIHAVINDWKLLLFGHVRCLPEGIPAHDVLQVSVESYASMVPHPNWRRKPGRQSRCTWLRNVLKATRLTAREAWTADDDREKWRVHRSTNRSDDDDEHVTTTRPKSEFWSIFDPTVTLTLYLFTQKFYRVHHCPRVC